MLPVLFNEDASSLSDNYKMYFGVQIIHVRINLIKIQVSLVDEGTSGQSEDCMTPSPERPEALAEEYM